MAKTMATAYADWHRSSDLGSVIDNNDDYRSRFSVNAPILVNKNTRHDHAACLHNDIILPTVIYAKET